MASKHSNPATTDSGAPVPNNLNSLTADPCGPVLQAGSSS